MKKDIKSIRKMLEDELSKNIKRDYEVELLSKKIEKCKTVKLIEGEMFTIYISNIKIVSPEEAVPGNNILCFGGMAPKGCIVTLSLNNSATTHETKVAFVYPRDMSIELFKENVRMHMFFQLFTKKENQCKK